ncbi:Uncharacterised protein [Serratia entomophila]|nr:Uncharacterised protein [Serratia entomophila]CAI1836254.1 Uncharacterised protein [Serratia entomophila]
MFCMVIITDQKSILTNSFLPVFDIFILFNDLYLITKCHENMLTKIN